MAKERRWIERPHIDGGPNNYQLKEEFLADGVKSLHLVFERWGHTRTGNIVELYRYRVKVGNVTKHGSTIHTLPILKSKVTMYIKERLNG